MKKIFQSFEFRSMTYILAWICFVIGLFFVLEEFERQNKLNRPFANFALRNPRATLQMIDEQVLREMNERQRLEYYAYYWKQKTEELKEKAKLSFVYGAMR